MFMMMNEAPIAVVRAAALAYRGYRNVEYAQQRMQGAIVARSFWPQVLIIEHWDVKRMLFSPKGVC